MYLILVSPRVDDGWLGPLCHTASATNIHWVLKLVLRIDGKH
jgi:hypothetical protein